MSELFITLVNMSLSAGWIVLAVALLRLLLHRAPRRITVWLWAVVAVRLICPFTLESVVSLIPSAEVIDPQVLQGAVPQIHSGVAYLNAVVNPVLEGSLPAEPGASISPWQVVFAAAACLWLLGVLVMLTYAVISYLRLHRRMRTAVLLRDNVYQSEGAATPFVLGLLRPRIYLPFAVSETEQAHVIAHEQAHICRRDHWWKPLGFLLLAVYWFNPLMWLGYLLLCRDIELACDEKVVATLGKEQKADYSQALLACSVHRRAVTACPLAFGEVGVKARVRSVLHYKKPALWVLIVTVAVSIAVAVCFLTSPVTTPEAPSSTEEPTPLSEVKLRQAYPDYFDLSTDGGLTVYVWQMAEDDFRCYPINTNEAAVSDMSFAFTDGASIEEMRAILSLYGLARSQITLHPVVNPLSSYYYVIDDAYRQMLAERFWDTTQVALIQSTVGCDVDGDGKTEQLSVSAGPTSGLYTLRITATEDGVAEYNNVFLLGGGVGFVQDADGSVWFWGALMEDAVYSRHRIGVEDGNLYMEKSDGTRAAYWGAQGLYEGNWGLTMDVRVENIRTLEVVFTHTAAQMAWEGELYTTPAFEILGVVEGDLVPYGQYLRETLDLPYEEREFFWDDVVYEINQDGTTLLQADLSSTYGTLPAGNYVLRKQVQLHHDGGSKVRTYIAALDIPA